MELLSEILSDRHNWKSNAGQLFLIFGASLGFLPFALGRRVLETTSDVAILDSLEGLETSIRYKGALIASIGACCPLILDYLLDFIWQTPKQPFHSFVPRKEIFLSVILPDLFILLYVLPLKKFDWLYGLVACRDTIFHGGFLLYMHQLLPCVWSKRITWTISLCILSSNNIIAFGVLADKPSYTTDTITMTRILIGLASICLAISYYNWFRIYLYSKDSSIRKRLNYSISFGFAYGIFYCQDFIILFIPSAVKDAKWNLVYGENYLTMYTYAMAFTGVVVSLCTIRLSRIETANLKRMFIRYISHEIRTPLNTIFLGVCLIEKDIQSGRAEECLTTTRDLIRCTQFATGILNDMVFYDKIGSEPLILDKKLVDIWSFIKESISPMHSQAMEAGIQLRVLDQGSLRTMLHGYQFLIDTVKLHQVMRNLLTNAFTFTKAGKSVEVAVRLSDSEDGPEHNGLVARSVRTASSLRGSPVRFLPVSHTPPSDLNTFVREVQDPPSAAQYVYIDIKDEGEGMPKDTQSMIFREMDTFSPGTIKNGEASCLGLFVCKEIVDAHGGEISVFSEGEGLGCKFTIRLPVHRLLYEQDPFDDLEPESLKSSLGSSLSLNQNEYTAAPILLPLDRNPLGDSFLEPTNRIKPDTSLRYSEAAIAAVENNCKDTSNQLKHVLLVDDSAMTRKMMKRTLESRGFRCDEAVDGKDAIQKYTDSLAQNRPYDAIAMDYQMPQMDGPTSAKIIRGMGFTRPIIGVSGNVVQEDVQFFLSNGVDFVLPKPFDIELFVQFIYD